MLRLKNLVYAVSTGVILGGLMFSGCTKNADSPNANVKASISEEDLGLRKETIYSEKTITTDGAGYGKSVPGSGFKYKRAFENAPPMIPHDVEGMLPIEKNNNQCLTCHAPEVASSVGAVAYPKSHMTDLRTNKDLKGVLSQARFNCSACHAPQAEVPVAVANKFEPDFRKKGLNESSNLIDVINEGVR